MSVELCHAAAPRCQNYHRASTVAGSFDLLTDQQTGRAQLSAASRLLRNPHRCDAQGALSPGRIAEEAVHGESAGDLAARGTAAFGAEKPLVRLPARSEERRVGKECRSRGSM